MLADQIAGDGVLLDLSRAFIQFGDFGIPGKTFDFILLHVAVIAQKLNGLVADLDGGSRGRHLGHGGELGIDAFLIEISGRLVDQQPGHLDFCGHIGEFVLGHLELADLFPELLPFGHVGQGPVKGALRGPQGLGGNQNTDFL